MHSSTVSSLSSLFILLVFERPELPFLDPDLSHMLAFVMGCIFLQSRASGMSMALKSSSPFVSAPDVACFVSQQICQGFDATYVSAVPHGRCACCVMQQACELCHTADMSAVSHSRHVLGVPHSRHVCSIPQPTRLAM